MLFCTKNLITVCRRCDSDTTPLMEIATPVTFLNAAEPHHCGPEVPLDDPFLIRRPTSLCSGRRLVGAATKVTDIASHARKFLAVPEPREQRMLHGEPHPCGQGVDWPNKAQCLGRHRGMSMLISQILRGKRPEVVVISPDEGIRSAVAIMVREHVGALVVVDEEQQLLGVISEREIIRNLDLNNPNPMNASVREVMRTDGPIAALDDTVRSVMEAMTVARARHVPVVAYHRPVGVVSIGDLVKSRLDETIRENSVLQEIARVHWMTS
jgi:CBS domain-containing protein